MTLFKVTRFITFLLLFLPKPSSAQSFDKFIAGIRSENDSLARIRLINDYMSKQTFPVVEKNLIHFVYRGKGEHIAVPGEMNGWNPAEGMLSRVEGTDLYYRTDSLALNGRAEYKVWVDSAWMLDPLNHRTSMGGYGANSDVWMPKYRPSVYTNDNPNLNHGTLDTFWIESKILQRKHPVFVYTAPGRDEDELLPYLLVTDGSDYLSFGKTNLIIDNLIAQKRIIPLIAIFVDPRTDLLDNATNHRMNDYAASDDYLDFLEKEVVPFVASRYPLSKEPLNRAILGASMGGLISTYAVVARPGFMRNCGAQSPAYNQADTTVRKRVDALAKSTARVYIQAGTVNDTRTEAKIVRRALESKGAVVRYEDFPEGHNWTNWKTHLPKILEYFFGRH